MAGWCIAKLAIEEQVVGLVRFIDERPPDARSLKTAVGISWRYADAGLPGAEENETMNDFERAIDPLTESAGRSQMVYVRTAFGVKEWLFYAHDSDAFMRAFNEHLAGRPRYPLEINFYADPKWKLWREFIEPIKDKAEWEDPAAN